MKIRAVVEFEFDDNEFEDAIPEPEVEKFVGEDVRIKSGEYNNLYTGTIISAEEIVE
jgi:hypothetical protein